MNEYTECPECGNDRIKLNVHEVFEAVFSVKTGKCLNRSYLSSETWSYLCKCGWQSEIITQ